jgi:CRISPR-associated endoribonuclease Cas6
VRFELDFKTEENYFVKDYRRQILSFIKQSLERYAPVVLEYFYKNPKQKEYTFSIYLPIEKIEDDKIYLKENRFKMYFSIKNPIYALHFYNAFLKMKGQLFSSAKNPGFILTSLRKSEEKKILKEGAVFKTKSPIIIREHNREENKDWYHLLSDPQGVEVLKRNLKVNLEGKFSEKILNELEIIPIEIKKNVADFYGIKMQGSSGIFALKGDMELLNHFYMSGFGSKTSSGFGYLTLIG